MRFISGVGELCAYQELMQGSFCRNSARKVAEVIKNVGKRHQAQRLPCYANQQALGVAAGERDRLP